MLLVKYLSAEFTTDAATPETKKSVSTSDASRQSRSITARIPSPPFSAIRNDMNERDTSAHDCVSNKNASSLRHDGTTIPSKNLNRLANVASTAAAARRRGADVFVFFSPTRPIAVDAVDALDAVPLASIVDVVVAPFARVDALFARPLGVAAAAASRAARASARVSSFPV